MAEPTPTATLTGDLSALAISALTRHDPRIAQEARCWTTGVRGPVVDDPDQLAPADLGSFVQQALSLGSAAITATGQSQDSQALSRRLRDVGDRTVSAETGAA